MANVVKRCKPLLGTYVSVELYSDKFIKQDLLTKSSIIFDEIYRIQKIMNFYDSQSELSYINQYAYQYACEISFELKDILQHACSLSDKSNGLFDVTFFPSLSNNNLSNEASWQDIIIKDNLIKFNKNLNIDLGGIAKGYAVDRAFKLFDLEDIDILVNAGGDLRMNNWKNKEVAICYSKKGSFIKKIMQNKGLATSASYYNNKSVIGSSNKLVVYNGSISIFADNTMLADALTKVVWLKKDVEINLLKQFNASGILVSDNGDVSNIS